MRRKCLSTALAQLPATEKKPFTISAHNVSVVSSTTITCTFGFFGAQDGKYDFVVKNPDGTEGRLAGGFTVTPFNPCGAGGGMSGLMLGVALGLLSLAGSTRLHKKWRPPISVTPARRSRSG
jgi:hypothetical protein